MFDSQRVRVAAGCAIAVLFVTVAAAQAPEPPLSDSRLTVHTLLREDLFAGFLAGDMARFTRGEKNIELLLEKRPSEKPGLLAWKAGAILYRAVRALEKNRRDEFDERYRRALELFSQARETAADPPAVAAVAAITGGSFVLFADRLPEAHRGPAWTKAYDAYQVLWKQQAPVVDQLPLHFRGELLGGLAQSAQRTGRSEEVRQYLDRMLAVLKDTPYERAAREWKSDPARAESSRLVCLSCHDQGRLTDRLTTLEKK